MKKILIIAAFIFSPIMFCSCRVNWFGSTVDAPWYAIAIPVVVIFVAGYFILMNSTFICPHCGTEFKPKWYQLQVCVHLNRKRLAKCPKCGKTSFCENKRYK